MKTETPAQRAYAIRLALGDGWKVPMPMTAFAALLAKQQGATRYDSSIISRIESGDRKLTLEDAVAYAAVDPQRRGRAWIAWGETEAPAEEASALDFVPDPIRDRPISAAEVARARAVRDAEQAETTGKQTPKVRKANGGRKRG